MEPRTFFFRQHGGKPKDKEIKEILVKAREYSKKNNCMVIVSGEFRRSDLRFIKNHFKLIPCMKEHVDVGAFYCEFEIPPSTTII